MFLDFTFIDKVILKVIISRSPHLHFTSATTLSFDFT